MSSRYWSSAAPNSSICARAAACLLWPTRPKRRGPTRPASRPEDDDDDQQLDQGEAALVPEAARAPGRLTAGSSLTERIASSMATTMKPTTHAHDQDDAGLEQARSAA